MAKDTVEDTGARADAEAVAEMVRHYKLVRRHRETPEDMYGVPENFLEVEVRNARTHGHGRKQFTDYEVITRVRCLCDYPYCHPTP